MLASGRVFRAAARMRCFSKPSSWIMVELVTMTSSIAAAELAGPALGQRLAGRGLPGLFESALASTRP